MDLDKKNFYEENGYLIFNINDDFLIDKVNSDIQKILKDNNNFSIIW